MKILIIYTGTIGKELNGIIHALRNTPNTLVFLLNINCNQEQILPVVDNIEFSDFDKILIYLTDDMNSCEYLDFLILQATRFSIPVDVIVANDYQSSCMPNWVDRYAKNALPLSTDIQLEDLVNNRVSNVFQDAQGNTLETNKLKRHC